jgi:hypothetical protein
VPSTAYPTIQVAVNDATCATINVAAGIYYELITINRSVMIRGAGQESTVVDGSHSGTVLTIVSGTVIVQGVTIQHGNGLGGGIWNSGTLTVKNSMVTRNFDSGILNASGTLIIQNSTVTGNGAFDGGGIWNSGTLTIKTSTVAGNVANVSGGIRNFSGTLTIENSTVTDNGAIDGGGILNNDMLIIQNSTIAGNDADFVGGIFNSGTAIIQNSTVTDNVADGGLVGGAAGGGIFNSGTLTLENCTVADNFARVEGGGIFNLDGALVTLIRVTFQNNTPDDCIGCPGLL